MPGSRLGKRIWCGSAPRPSRRKVWRHVCGNIFGACSGPSPRRARSRVTSCFAEASGRRPSFQSRPMPNRSRPSRWRRSPFAWSAHLATGWIRGLPSNRRQHQGKSSDLEHLGGVQSFGNGVHLMPGRGPASGGCRARWLHLHRGPCRETPFLGP